jgi:hypothetical protein
MYQDLYTAAVAERTRALQLEACRHNLMRLVTCCKPSALRRAMRAVQSRLRAGQLADIKPYAL